MQIVSVQKSIKKFTDFTDELYDGDRKFVPYRKDDLAKFLASLAEEESFALLATEENRVLGRVVCTVAPNKMLDTDRCGFFGMFECVHDQTVCDLLKGEATKRHKEMGATHLAGTYSRFRDNRTGVLVDGFDSAPFALTSYNKTYYDKLLTRFGLQKLTDTLVYKLQLSDAELNRIQNAAQWAQRKLNFGVERVRKTEKDAADIYSVVQAADGTGFHNIGDLKTFYDSVKKSRYFDKRYVFIARSNNGEPLGVIAALPNYFERYGKSQSNAANMFCGGKITSARVIMQYVVPQYQSMGVAIALYLKLFEALREKGVTCLETGLIAETNQKALATAQRVGGEYAHRYRIYYKKI